MVAGLWSYGLKYELTIALALPMLSWRRLAEHPLVPPLLVAGLAHFVLFADYSAWWGGWCFGPRYWTEAIPVLIWTALA
mgnify:CR=1 FL=1